MRKYLLLAFIPSLLYSYQSIKKPYYEVDVVEKTEDHISFKVWSKFDSTSIMIIKGEEINIVTDQILPNFCIVNRDELINNRLKITFVGSSITSSLTVRYHSYYELISFDNYKFYEGFYIESDDIVINQTEEGYFELSNHERDYDIPGRKVKIEPFLHFNYTMKDDYIEQAYLLLYLPFQTYPNIPYSYKDSGYAFALNTYIDQNGSGFFYFEDNLYFKMGTFELSLEKEEGFVQSDDFLLPNSLKNGRIDLSLNVNMKTFRMKYYFSLYEAKGGSYKTVIDDSDELKSYESEYNLK